MARDSIVLKTPTPSIDAEGAGPVEMATHIVQSIRLQLTQPTHGPYLQTPSSSIESISSHLMYGHCDSHDLSHREYFAVPPFQCGSSSVVVESRRELLVPLRLLPSAVLHIAYKRRVRSWLLVVTRRRGEPPRCRLRGGCPDLEFAQNY